MTTTRSNKLKVQYKPNSFFTLGVETDLSENTSNSLYLETTYKFDTPFEDQLEPITNIASNVWDKMFIPQTQSAVVQVQLHT